MKTSEKIRASIENILGVVGILAFAVVALIVLA